MITALPGIGRDMIDTRVRSLWRYAAALPVEVADPITMGEGLTPLVSRDWRGAPALFKLEWFSPTGSFKDRGASGDGLDPARPGRDAAARGQLRKRRGGDRRLCGGRGIEREEFSFRPRRARTRSCRRAPMAPRSSAFPERVRKRSDAAEREAARIFYAGHNWQPFFLQGTKTLAYELWEDLDFNAPDNVVIPTGAGSNVLGCDIGFSELLSRGEIARLPRLFAAQPENCAPLNASFMAGSDDLVPVEIRPTIAEGASIARPVRAREVLGALRRSGGGTVAVSEAEIEAALFDLSRIGLYAEPTSALAAAGLTKLIERGVVQPGETTVVVLTGSGLKATRRVGELLGAPPTR